MDWDRTLKNKVDDVYMMQNRIQSHFKFNFLTNLDRIWCPGHNCIDKNKYFLSSFLQCKIIFCIYTFITLMKNIMFLCKLKKIKNINNQNLFLYLKMSFLNHNILQRGWLALIEIFSSNLTDKGSGSIFVKKI